MAEPNRHTAYTLGYEDGFENREPTLISITDRRYDKYMDGFEAGTKDRDEVQRAGSSNA
jgi:hypothetical protein